MRKNIKRVISLLLVMSLLSPNVVYAEDDAGIFDSIGDWFNHAGEEASNIASDAWDGVSSAASDAWNGASSAVSDAWNGASSAVSDAWDGTTTWVGDRWNDISKWAVDSWEGISSWTVQAWDDSTKWVAGAWKDSSSFVSGKWDNFIIWVNTAVSGNPYSWMKTTVLENGVRGFDSYAAVRSFLDSEPDIDQINSFYDEELTELSLTDEDKKILWEMLQDWSNEKGLSETQVAELALPFLVRLVIEGESVIGEGTIFSGPVIGQYLVTILEAMNLDSADKATMSYKILHKTIEKLTRPVIIGDVDQNTLITEDQYYIENFSYLDGKYQVVMIVCQADEKTEYPSLKEGNLENVVKKYFPTDSVGEKTERDSQIGKCQDISFSYVASEEKETDEATNKTENTNSGKATAFWTDHYNYLFFIVTDQEWVESEYIDWLETVTTPGDNAIEFEVDMESDGSFYGINQVSQKYTINRIFDEEKFTVPMTGHGWAAERGNNLIDNIKGLIQGHHSVVVGDNNALNGPDRQTTYTDGSKLLIQTKYYNSASRSIAACFKEGKFRYVDSDGNPMAVEVPADQYQAAVEYMENRIKNGEVQGVTDPESAVNIVKKGNLTYQQAKHIAKAGTVESILYDSANACITATTSMGISAAVSFAINLWQGESYDTAIKESIMQGLQSGGTAFIISVLSSQLAKTGLNTAMIPASKVIVHALGPKVSAVIVNAFRPAGSAIYGAAAMQSAAKLLRGNAITATVTFAVLSAGDVSDIIRGRISWTQLVKNVSSTAAGITGGTLGYLGGAALGTAIMPGVGTAVGIIVSVAAGWGASEGASAIADMIAEDDADKMIRIIEEQFSTIAQEYFLNEEEVNESIENLQNILSAEMLKQMFQYKNHEVFARELIEMAIDPVVAQRDYIELPDEEEYSDYLEDVLESIYDDVNEETPDDTDKEGEE